MMSTDDSILLFEYFTASGEKDKCIISEAEAMIFDLVDDLKDYKLNWVLNESYSGIVENYANVNSILIEGDVIEWLVDNAQNFTKAIFIAGENNNNLYNITKILEDNNVKVYNCSSNASFIASDKFQTYEKLSGIVPQPKSFKMKIDKTGYWKRAIENLYEKWQTEDTSKPLKIIIKPLTGVDCEDIVLIENIKDLTLDLDKIFSPGSRVIIQEFVEGIDVSVSLISDGKKAVPISLNRQNVKLKNDKAQYLGGKLPYESKYKNEVFKIAVSAVESIEGLRGFVGVDLKISNDEVYLLEINSRFTTPYVGLKKITNINIGDTIIKLIDNELDINDLEINLDGEVEFKKSGDNLEVRRI